MGGIWRTRFASHPKEESSVKVFSTDFVNAAGIPTHLWALGGDPAQGWPSLCCPCPAGSMEKGWEGLELLGVFLCVTVTLGLCPGTSPDPAHLLCPLGDVWKHVPLRDPDSSVSTASTRQTLQKRPLHGELGMKWVCKEAITLQNCQILPSSLLVTLEAGAQEMPPHGLQKWSWAGGRCLNSGDIQPPLCPSQSFWNCIIWASCSFPFPPPSFPEEVKHKQI